MTAHELEQEIERTREHLGDTIDELAAKADMKARARARAAEVKARAADVSGRVRQSKAVQSQVLQRRWPVAVAAGVLIAGAVIIRRRRRGKASPADLGAWRSLAGPDGRPGR